MPNGVKDFLTQPGWLNFKLSGITCLVGKISRLNFLSQGPGRLSEFSILVVFRFLEKIEARAKTWKKQRKDGDDVQKVVGKVYLIWFYFEVNLDMTCHLRSGAYIVRYHNSDIMLIVWFKLYEISSISVDGGNPANHLGCIKSFRYITAKLTWRAPK